MMIEIMPESHDNILGMQASGKLTDADYKDVLIPRLEDLVDEHEDARFLYYLDEGFEGWEPGAAWDDAKLGIKLQKGLERMALVGGPKWAQWGMKLDNHLTRAEVKTFPIDELQDAWDWIES